jgi:hypothetical protein
VGIPTLLEVLLDLAHLPAESLLIEVIDVARDKSAEDATYLLQLLLLGGEVELEGTVSNTAVVESGHFQLVSSEDLRDFVSHLNY